MVQEKQLKELFKYIESNWDVCVEDVDKTDIKRIFGGVLCEDIMNDTDQDTDQEPEQVAEPAKQPAKPFDKDRFERMFCAVVANGGHELEHKQAIELTEEALAQLDAYYASKEGGNEK